MTVRRPRRALFFRKAAFGEGGRVERERAHAHLLLEGARSARVALVGGDVVRAALDARRTRSRRGRYMPYDGPVGDGDRAVAVARVEPVAGERWSLRPSALISVTTARFDVDDRRRRSPPGASPRRCAPSGATATYSGSRSWATVAPGPKMRTPAGSFACREAAEAGGADVVLRERGDAALEVDDADRAFRVDRVVVVRLALVGDERRSAPFGVKVSMSGSAPTSTAASSVAVGVEEGDRPGSSSDPPGARPRRARDVDEFGEPSRGVDLADCRRGRVGGVEHVDGVEPGVDDEEAVRRSKATISCAPPAKMPSRTCRAPRARSSGAGRAAPAAERPRGPHPRARALEDPCAPTTAEPRRADPSVGSAG